MGHNIDIKVLGFLGEVRLSLLIRKVVPPTSKITDL